MALTVILIIAAIIFALITFIKLSSSNTNSKSNKSEYTEETANPSYPSEYYELRTTISEGDRRLEILNESSQIIEITKNIETLLTRMNVINENLDWFLEKEKLGSKYKLKNGASEMKNKLRERTNDMICRILSDEVSEYKLKLEKLKSDSAKENRTTKICERINDFQNHLIKDTANYNNCLSTIKNLHLDVKDAFGNM